MVKLYVEGGGDTAALKAACREGFTTFITKTGLQKRPRVVACGSRRDAYDSFCMAVANGEEAMLLVDSEAAVSTDHQSDENRSRWLPWSHLGKREGDRWTRPKNSEDTDCHLMVQMMESWFLADRQTMSAFFANGFKAEKLPAVSNAIEAIAKTDVYQGLKSATAECKSKAPYSKGEHSFKLLAKIDPDKVTAASPWALRFVEELKKKMSA